MSTLIDFDVWDASLYLTAGDEIEALYEAVKDRFQGILSGDTGEGSVDDVSEGGEGSPNNADLEVATRP